MLHPILILAVMLITIGWQAVTPTAGKLMVAWIVNDDLMIWQQGDSIPAKIASGDLRAEFIAPDGDHIAFTRGTASHSESLWVVNRDGRSEKEIVSPDILAGSIIGQVDWLDSSTLYFNTLQITDNGQVLNNDLWRSDIQSGTTKRLLASGEGGHFTFSPDGEHIVLARSGEYDGADGIISVVNAIGKNAQTLLNFTAVSTGSEYTFYPRVFWEPDSSAVRVAIPEKDLIYNDSTGMTTLWRLGIDSAAEKLGTIQASYFGQLRWSRDTQYMSYMRRVGDAASNQFELVTAAGDGSNAETYTAGVAGTLQFSYWFRTTNQFLYGQGELGDNWIGTPGKPPQAIPGKIFAPQFVTNSLYVYITVSDFPVEIRYADLQHPNDSTLIATLDTMFSEVSAVFAQ